MSDVKDILGIAHTPVVPQGLTFNGLGLPDLPGGPRPKKAASRKKKKYAVKGALKREVQALQDGWHRDGETMAPAVPVKQVFAAKRRLLGYKPLIVSPKSPETFDVPRGRIFRLSGAALEVDSGASFGSLCLVKHETTHILCNLSPKQPSISLDVFFPPFSRVTLLATRSTIHVTGYLTFTSDISNPGAEKDHDQDQDDLPNAEPRLFSILDELKLEMRGKYLDDDDREQQKEAQQQASGQVNKGKKEPKIVARVVACVDTACKRKFTNDEAMMQHANAVHALAS